MRARSTPKLSAVLLSVAAVCAVAVGGPKLAAAQGAVAADPDGGAVVLAYGRFGEDDLPSASIRLDQFDEHLFELQSGGYAVLPLPRIVQALRSGTPLPERTVAITIDDASRSAFVHAVPRLRAAGLPFTLFVSPDPLDRGAPTHMSWGELRETLAAGGNIGVMPASPVPMPARALDENRAAILRSLTRLRQELGVAPVQFAYPYGDLSQPIRDLVAELPFQAAFGQQSGVASAGTDPFGLPRFIMNETFGGIERFLIATNALPMPVSDVAPSDPILRRNSAVIGFSVAERVGGLDRLACFASGIGRLPLERLGANRIEIRPPDPLPPGRVRINCTLPTPESRWRWFGMQLSVPE